MSIVFVTKIGEIFKLLKYNIDRLLHAAAAKTGVSPNRSELGEALGLHRLSVGAMINSDSRPELEILEKWLNYFRANGLPNVKLSDLVKEVPDEVTKEAEIEVGAGRERELA